MVGRVRERERDWGTERERGRHREEERKDTLTWHSPRRHICGNVNLHIESPPLSHSPVFRDSVLPSFPFTAVTILSSRALRGAFIHKLAKLSAEIESSCSFGSSAFKAIFSPLRSFAVRRQSDVKREKGGSFRSRWNAGRDRGKETAGGQLTYFITSQK